MSSAKQADLTEEDAMFYYFITEGFTSPSYPPAAYDRCLRDAHSYALKNGCFTKVLVKDATGKIVARY